MNQLRPGQKPDSVVDEATYVNLRREWWLAVLLGALTIIAGTGVLFCCYPLPSSLMGSIPLALVTTYILYLLGCNLRLNTRDENQSLRATLGPANWITLARGGLIAILAGFLLLPWPGRPNGPGWAAWIPGALYMAAVFGDALDGFIARITATPSRLGNLLDTRIDALGILVACLLAIHYGQIPDYYIIAGLAYYLMRLAIWVRRKGGRPCFEIRSRPGARMMAGIQMAFLGIVLLPGVSPQFTHVAAIFILIPFLAGFLLDWRVVSGHEKFVHVA